MRNTRLEFRFHSTRVWCFSSLCSLFKKNFFSKLFEIKIKADVFIGPKIRKILECTKFFKKLSTKERAAWNSFAALLYGFLDNHKAENYVELVAKLVKIYDKMGLQNVT